MNIEQFIYITITVISISSFMYIPKKMVRKALLSLLAFQATTWFTSIILVERGTIAFPVREFVKATKVNFIPQFLFYPALFMWFIILFPEGKSILFKTLHYILFVSAMVWFIYFTSHYTAISRFSSSMTYLIVIKAYIRNFLQYVICHIYINWFYKKRTQHEGV